VLGAPGWVGGQAVAIRTVLKDSHSFGPDEIDALVCAFDDTLRELELVDRGDPAAMVVAKLIVDLAKKGERDPIRLRQGTLRAACLALGKTARPTQS
jgi:hypothetical protein